MNVLPTLQPILNELTQRFGERLSAPRAERPNEIYFDAGMDLVSGLCGHLYKRWNARLVSVFAEDARTDGGVLQIYYVYALDAAHGFIILRVRVAPEPPD